MTTPEREIRDALLDCLAFVERERDGWIDTTSIYSTDEGDPVRATKSDVDEEDWETIDEIEAADALIARIKGAADAIEAALLAAKAEEREACAVLAGEFSWQLPLLDGARMNEATDDAACMVCEQVANAIRARGAPAAVKEAT